MGGGRGRELCLSENIIYQVRYVSFGPVCVVGEGVDNLV